MRKGKKIQDTKKMFFDIHKIKMQNMVIIFFPEQ